MIHTSYTVGITTAEFKALQSVMINQDEWLKNAIQTRAKRELFFESEFEQYFYQQK